ncbi:DNA-binding transcriptional LysR family regulator [Paenibacillus endophyticus]|uniref:DNA-binding transcriptional LysR family regulator n=1 Tax=Paenibacillus endophyticus TaxID=1294268 RepID=A0A7W5CEY3_9BACL|nr:LysR family transcriptional regulator [Paenibacillus endophyticus]MBB3155999.1 DNA-binding transcriptional LysR family regulator [Paenibacillus endophyticus]
MSSADKLQTFLTLVECRSFTETAKRLYTSQPTVSNHIQQLENQYGAALFHRSGKSVVLTNKGKILYDYAQRIMSLYQEAASELQNDTQQGLHIYICKDLNTYLLSDVIKRFIDKYPDKSSTLQVVENVEIQKKLQLKKTNLAIMPLTETNDYSEYGYDSETLFAEDLLLVASPEHPWSKRKMLYLRDLSHQKLLVPKNEQLQAVILKALNRSQIPIEIIYMKNFDEISEELKNRPVLSFLPYYAVNKSISSGELITRPVAGMQIKRRNGFVIRKNTILTELEQAFYSFAIEAF